MSQLNKSRWLELTALAIVLLFVARLVWQLPEDSLWDCAIRYESALSFRAGENYYDRHPGNIWEFVYTPPAIWFFVPLSYLPLATACQVGLGLKLAMLVGLVALWRLVFLRREGNGWFYLFCLFGFNSTIYLDLRAANISVEEQFIIWGAFALLLRRKYWLFSALILLVSLFKVIPLLLLTAIWLTDAKNKPRLFFGSLAALAVFHAAAFALAPWAYAGFLGNVLGHSDVGSSSNYYFIIASLDALKSIAKVDLSQFLQPVYLVGLAVVLGLFYLTTRKLSQAEHTLRAKLFALCLAYSLIFPNFGDYAYVLGIAPAFFIMVRARALPLYVPLLVLAFLSPYSKLPLPSAINYVWEHVPVLTTYGAFGLLVAEVMATPATQWSDAQPPTGLA